tara:strand:- start:1315 stop:1863 length:549 start_codon:yes stop_codon:yes gene_type:complete
MVSKILNFIKNQKGNLIIFFFIFTFATYFNYVNSVQNQIILIKKKHADIEQLLDFHKIFMKRFLQEASFKDTYSQQSLQTLIDSIAQKSSKKDSLGYASTWITLFNTYLSSNNSERITDYYVIKQNYQALLSSIIRYNVEVNRYQDLISQRPFNLIYFNTSLETFRDIENPVLNLSGFEIVH